MTEGPRENPKTQLALAIAQGVSVTAWARANGVPRRTAFSWAKDPLVRKTVESCRRRTTEHAIRRLVKQSAWAADGIAMLAKVAESDSVKLEAFRAVLADMTGSLGPGLRTASAKSRGLFKSTANERHLLP
jgi:hypothetical protein